MGNKESSVEFIRENSKDVVEETWLLVTDTRHGRKGWRASRYIISSERIAEIKKSWPEQAKSDPVKTQVLDNIIKRIQTRVQPYEMVWDEYYMFFETLDVAYDAFQRGDLMQGRIDF